MARFTTLLFLQQIFASLILATRIGEALVRETPYIPGYFAKQAEAPLPTSPPIALRQLVPRDAATCGWMMSDGSPNVCGSSQYCMTSATGSFGIWNCCNPDSCYTQTACSYSSQCKGDSPYCVTSYMSDSGTTYSRFMCGTTSSLIFMVYKSSDLPQYSASLASASAASKSAADKSKSTSASSTQASSSGASAASQAASSSAAPSSTSKSDSGMSGGAIAGTAVGSIAAVAVIGGLAFFAWRLKKKNNTNKPQVAEVAGEPVHEKTYYGYHAPEYHPDYSNQPHTPGQGFVHEMDAPAREPQEMDAAPHSPRK